MKLRLLLFEQCNRNCLGCCNKDWDLTKLEKETNFVKYKYILLTGGEPMLNPAFIEKTVHKIRKASTAKIFVYTAKIDNIDDVLHILNITDGITVTLHDQSDVKPFLQFNNILLSKMKSVKKKSLRCNIFKNILIDKNICSLWKIKDNITWIKNCPLPEGEVFKRV